MKYNGVGVDGQVTIIARFHQDVTKTSALAALNGHLDYAVTRGTEGIYIQSLETDTQYCVYVSTGIADIAAYGSKPLFTSAVEHKVMGCDLRADCHVDVKALTGSDVVYIDRPAPIAKFKNPHGICVEGKTVLVTDPTS